MVNIWLALWQRRIGVRNVLAVLPSAGRKVERHHPVPKSRGGVDTVAVHPICHRTLHAVFRNVELGRFGFDRGALRANPAVERFLDWVASKPPDFHAPTARRR